MNAINEPGQAVGAGAFADHPYDAYVWKKGVATDLGFLEGDCYSEAFVIGSKGQIAGESYPCTSIPNDHSSGKTGRCTI